MKANDNSGVVLVAVVCFTAIAAILALGLLTESSDQMKQAQRQLNLEQAFYVAEGGAERAVSYIARVGVTATTNITGAIGNGTYQTFIIPAGGSHALGGSLGINPNNSPDNEFVLIKPDGTTITRDDLAGDVTEYDSVPCVYYSGPAILVHVKPKGSGNQNTIVVDGTNFVVENSTTYDFVGEMSVVVQNDSRNNGNHRANGHWFLGTIGGNDIAIYDGSGAGGGDMDQYEIHSIGTVNGIRRNVILNGVHQQSWAKYALWYNSGPGSLYFKGGEVFNGPVHANGLVYLSDNPTFNALLTSARSTWGEFSAAAVFNEGFVLNAASQNMASVKFTSMLANASLVLTGNSSLIFSGTNALISNAGRGWTQYPYMIPLADNGLIYVATNSANGYVDVGGTLDGRLSVVSAYDIRITNHIRYAVHPTNGSDDALGLIARHDVVVRTNAPNDVEIFAHIIAEGSATSSSSDGSFYVQNYDQGDPRGALNVYGGIVQFYRGAVGQFDTGSGAMTHGYYKNYVFDTRFATDPPPHYPALTNEYTWSNWRDKSR